MLVNGSDCTITVKTSHFEMDIPYSDETVREAVSFLQEEASIEGDSVCRGIRKSKGVTGCVVTPLTIGTAPLLFFLAMGSAGKPVFVSETKNLHQINLELLPMYDTEQFDLIQDRQGTNNNEQLTNNNGERRIFEGCKVKSFELRVMRGEAIKLKLDIYGERTPMVYTQNGFAERKNEERFKGDDVSYSINGKEYTNIYGITLACRKEHDIKTEVMIKRAKEKGNDIPEIIDDLVITAQLNKDNYEYRQYGTFKIHIRRLIQLSDETEINASGAVISPLRYYVAGEVKTEVYANEELAIGNEQPIGDE